MAKTTSVKRKPGRLHASFLVDPSRVKPQARQRAVREARKVIVSFRLRKSEAERLLADLEKNPCAGVRSLKQFCRKLTIDFVNRRLVYVEDIDRQIEPDGREKARELMGIGAPDSRLIDTRFIRALRDYLVTDENWRKLRLFMLMAGGEWEKLGAQREKMCPSHRLDLVRGMLRDMARKS